MTNLEKSIRHHMAFYGPELRAGKYWRQGDAGATPAGFRGYIQRAVANVDAGKVTDITIYVCGDAAKRDHFLGGGVDITDALAEYLSGDESWDALIGRIEEIVRQ